MLTELRVENLGIIDEVSVVLGPGLTAITGETGAGKTLLVEALNLLLGGRADPTLVRDGATEARVEGRFVLGDPERADDEVVLARVVPATGRSRAYIDGRLATVGELAAHGRALVDLHGQHEQQSLLVPLEQRALLDAFVGEPAERATRAVTEARSELRAIDDDLAGLGGDERARARELDLLRFELDEIASAELEDPDEAETLAAEEDVLANAAALRDGLEAARRSLDGPATDAVGDAMAALAGPAWFAPLEARLASLQAELADLAHETRVAAEGVVDDPDRLAQVRARRQRLRELCRKYGPTLAAVREFAVESGARLAHLEGAEERRAALVPRRERAEAGLARAQAALLAARRAGAPVLAAAVTAQLAELALGRAECHIEVDAAGRAGAGAGSGVDGGDGSGEVTFMLAANPGESARPLAKAASGGELSRVMLALRVVLSEAPPTLVFDEVDAGLGGEAGVAVGRALALLGGKHQVLCVTHLAQVGAFADAQLSVRKEERDGRTRATVELLLDDARVNELSRMLAGVGESAHARRHARELLSVAGRQRAEARS
ncbi:MAG: repair protein RecN [Actinomycetota bacterium]|nr:repair protein RecN [Actinomycetota bacterium]